MKRVLKERGDLGVDGIDGEGSGGEGSHGDARGRRKDDEERRERARRSRLCAFSWLGFAMCGEGMARGGESYRDDDACERRRFLAAAVPVGAPSRRIGNWRSGSGKSKPRSFSDFVGSLTCLRLGIQLTSNSTCSNWVSAVG